MNILICYEIGTETQGSYIAGHCFMTVPWISEASLKEACAHIKAELCEAPEHNQGLRLKNVVLRSVTQLSD